MADGNCAVEEDGGACGRKSIARGWCTKHWQRWQRTGDPLGVPPKPTECTVIEGGQKCGRRTAGRGMCERHYTRWLRNGDALVSHRPTYRQPAEERFWPKVDANGVCWEWTSARDANGYGRFDSQSAHRWAWANLVGQIPDGLELDHLCRNRSCVNPDHLEPVAGIVNRARSYSVASINGRKTHCINGHPFEGNNVMVRVKPSGRVARQCRACHYARTAARRRKAA